MSVFLVNIPNLSTIMYLPEGKKFLKENLLRMHFFAYSLKRIKRNVNLHYIWIRSNMLISMMFCGNRYSNARTNGF